MFDYVGEKCPVCNEIFDNDSDVVVCPECGTPHHRKCYFENKGCANENLHNTDYDYQKEKRKTARVVVQENILKQKMNNENAGLEICPKCGIQNSKTSLFCQSCGNSLVKDENQTEQDQKFNQYTGDIKNIIPEGAFVSPNDEIDGIPAKDWALYIGNAAAYYLFNFKRQDSGESRMLSSFTFSAALIPGYYFLYRRMWLIGIIVNVILCALNIPSSLILLTNLEIAIPFTYDAMLMSKFAAVASVLSFIVNIASGFLAVKLFRKSTARKLKKIKKNSKSDEEYYKKLKRLSGPSKVVIGLIIISALFSYYAAFAIL